MTWVKEHLSSLLWALGAFVLPAAPLIALLQLMVIIEYVLSHSVNRNEKDFQRFTMMDAATKSVGFILIIFLGIIADSAFKIKVENITVLVQMGLVQPITPIAYLLSMMCIISEGKAIDKVYKKRYKSSLLDQFNFLPSLLEKLGYKKK
jgi:hypothetical protein